MFDLNQLTASSTTVINIVHPVTGAQLYCDDDNKDKASWTMLSKHTKESKKHAAEFGRLVKKEFEGKKLQDFTDEDTEKLNAMTVDHIALVTTDINLIMDGEKVKCNKTTIKKLLLNEEFAWLKSQVENGLNDPANFINT